MSSLSNHVALATLLLWPVIPLFWVPVHCGARWFRRIGLFTYMLPFVTWLPLAWHLFTLRGFLLAYQVTLPIAINVFGIVLLVLGTALQLWTYSLLTGPVIAGMPEVTGGGKTTMMTAGPFSVIRHPTYLSHTLMLLGIFLWTGIGSIGIITLADALIVNAIIIPLEERELTERFGGEFEKYRKRVPRRIVPWLRFR